MRREELVKRGEKEGLGTGRERSRLVTPPLGLLESGIARLVKN